MEKDTAEPVAREFRPQAEASDTEENGVEKTNSGELKRVTSHQYNYQCLFENTIVEEQGARYRRRNDQDFRSRQLYQPNDYNPSVQQLLFRHLEGETSVKIIEGAFAAQVVDFPSLNIRDVGEYGRLRVLLSPPRVEATDEDGRPLQYNPEAPMPFDNQTFRKLVETLDFHKECLTSSEIGKVSRLRGESGITSICLETYSYRTGWYKLSLSFKPHALATDVFIHNLEPTPHHYLAQKLQYPSVLPLTIHPMLLPTFLFEILSNHCFRELNRLFSSSINVEHSLGLSNYSMFAHFKDNQMDDELAAERAFGDGQALCALEERMEFNIMMGKKMIPWLLEFKSIVPDGQHKDEFLISGSIIHSRLQYLVEALELQLPRLKRTKGHTLLNRTGLEGRQAAQGNKISYQIALESKADSSAMKAIAVLTMFFLPATFVAAFFAMPLFDWDADTESAVVKKRFWIYWAVTLPGTLLVLAVWRVWWKFTYWNQDREVKGESIASAVREWLKTWGPGRETDESFEDRRREKQRSWSRRSWKNRNDEEPSDVYIVDPPRVLSRAMSGR